MKREKQILAEFDDATLPGYKDAPWPERGRYLFGPWCLLGAWPAVFGVVEKIEPPQHGEKESQNQ